MTEGQRRKINKESGPVRLAMRVKYKDGRKTHNAFEPVFILETHNQSNYKCLPKFNLRSGPILAALIHSFYLP